MKIHGNCPFGCGPQLHTDAKGRVTCVGMGCPYPLAVDMLLNEVAEHEHTMQFDNKQGYVLQHPLCERVSGHLFDCEVQKAWITGIITPPKAPGLYRVCASPEIKEPWKLEHVADIAR